MRSAILVVLFALACGGGGRPLTAKPASSSMLMPALEVRLLTGASWSPVDARGQVVVLEVWATYCKPCREAFPRLDRLAKTPGVTVIGLAVDDDDAAVATFLAEVPVEFAIARTTEDAAAQAPLSITRLPTVIVLDRAGRVRYRGEELDAAQQARLPALVEGLLAE